MATRRETEHILGELSAAQQGIVARAQLVDRGLSRSAIDWLVRTGRVAVRHPGVYQVGPLPLPRSAEHAAILACGGKARVSHASAARLRGLLEADSHVQEVDVTVARHIRRRLEGVTIHRVRDLRDDEATELHGMPVTTPARTLLDLAESGRPRLIEQAFATALRKQLVTSAAMREMVGRHSIHRGAPLWRQILAHHDDPAFTRSQAETKLLEITRRARLPRPELNVLVLGYEVDVLWRDARVVAEVDGYAFHHSGQRFTADRRRDAELTAAGYRVLRFSWADLNEREQELRTVVRLAQTLVR